MKQKSIKHLVVFKKLKIGPVALTAKRIKAPWELTLLNDKRIANELLFSYEENVFDPLCKESRNMAAMAAAQPAINYGLFCREIVFDGPFDETPAFGSTYLNFGSKRGVPWYVRTSKISTSGIIGNPTGASTEKGQRIWEITISHLVRFVEEIKRTPLENLYQRHY